MEIHRTLSSSIEIAYKKATRKYEKVNERYFYVVMTGCTWKDIPRKYGSKSTVHRFHLYLCEHGTYQKIFNELLNKGYDLKKIGLSHCFTDTKDIPAKKGEISAMMDTKK
ncbi:transposase [Methanosarcina sp. UBA5]|uniref:transposase n=1 Tax=Methanosarcina sp. UBA5 TaxID=1915593 RepID=UPI0025D613DE|nr:transposase [Methanosarcina sp. UBA5]